MPDSGAQATTAAWPSGQDAGGSRAAAPKAAAEPKVERVVPGTGTANRHVLAVLVNNQPGVLNRVASLVRARNFNIESLAVGHTERPDVSRMTITLRGDDFAVEQMEKQLYRLVDVLKVQAMPAAGSIEHELALIKVRATDRVARSCSRWWSCTRAVCSTLRRMR